MAANSFIIRTSAGPSLQLLCYLHFPAPLGSADSKGFIRRKISPQTLSNQHFPARRESAGNKGLITPVESALTKNPPLTPVESALPKNQGGGVADRLCFPRPSTLDSQSSALSRRSNIPTFKPFNDPQTNISTFELSTLRVQSPRLLLRIP